MKIKAGVFAVVLMLASRSLFVVADASLDESQATRNATAAELGGPSGPATGTIPNAYSNMSDPEFYLLQQLSAELARVSKQGLDEALADAHEGRYGESNYIEMRQAFHEAADALNAALRTAPVDKAKVDEAIKAMKLLVLDIDDVFVYNAGFLRQMRNWNECKRVLRRMDGLVYREGGLRRLESIWDASTFFNDIGKTLNVHGLLGNMDDGLHKTNPTGQVDSLIGHHTGGRRVATIWMVPNSVVHGSLQNANSDLNDGLAQ